MNRVLILVAAGAASAAPAQAPAQAGDELRLSGSARIRYETIEGQARAGFVAAESLVNLRTILTARYGSGPVKAVAELFDSRVYSPGPRSAVSTNEVNALELVQAHVTAEFGAAPGAGVRGTVQAGRFLMALGSRRLVAADDYRNTTNSFTGVRGDLQLPGGYAATLFYTLPQVRLPDDLDGLRRNRRQTDRESFDLRLFGAVLSMPLARDRVMLTGQYHRLDERDAPGLATRNRHLDTLGVQLFRAPAAGVVDFDVEAIGQRGSIRASAAPGAAARPVRAGFVHAEAGYQFAGKWAPHVALEYDVASGDKGGRTHRRFDTLFGMRRGDFAPSGIYATTGRANISTIGFRVDVARSKRFDAFLSIKELWLASRRDAFSTTGVRDASGRSGRHAGRQLDARMRWFAIPAKLQLEADMVLLDKGRFLRTAPNAPRNGDTTYLSLNATAFF